jgi:hypothetical protein
VGVSSFQPLGSGPHVDPEEASVLSAGTLGAIRHVVGGLREVPGRKSVVLFSENLQLFIGRDADPRVMDEVRRLTDAANRSSVVIYSIDPRGLQTYSLTAVRIFRRVSGLMYGCQVLNAQTGQGNQTELELHTRLFHDGKQIYEGNPMPLDTKSQPYPKSLIAGGAMKLGPGMLPGDYVLQVIVTEKLAKDKYATTAQSMDFEIK